MSKVFFFYFCNVKPWREILWMSDCMAMLFFFSWTYLFHKILWEFILTLLGFYFTSTTSFLSSKRCLPSYLPTCHTFFSSSYHSSLKIEKKIKLGIFLSHGSVLLKLLKFLYHDLLFLRKSNSSLADFEITAKFYLNFSTISL